MIALGVAGAGFVFHHGYAPHLLHPGARFAVRGISDPDAAARQAAARLFPEARIGAALEDILSCIDVLLISSPNHTHVPAAVAALRGGVPCLIEKPVATRLEELAALEGVMRESGHWAGGATVCRWREDVTAWLEDVAAIGPVEQLELLWRRHAGAPARSRRGDAAEDGVFPDLGYHLADLAGVCLRFPSAEPEVLDRRKVCDRPSTAHWYQSGTQSLRAQPGGAVECDVSLTVGLNGARVRIEVAWQDPEPGDLTRLIARGARGSAVFEGLLGVSDQRRVPYQRCVRRDEAGRIVHERQFDAGPRLHLDAFGQVLARFADSFHLGPRASELAEIAFSMRLIEAAAA